MTDVRLRFVKQTLPIPGMKQYRALRTGVSMVVSFDRRHPGLKWRASYQDQRAGRDRRTVHLPEGYETRDAAADALLAAYYSLFN